MLILCCDSIDKPYTGCPNQTKLWPWACVEMDKSMQYGQIFVNQFKAYLCIILLLSCMVVGRVLSLWCLSLSSSLSSSSLPVLSPPKLQHAIEQDTVPFPVDEAQTVESLPIW